MSATYERRLLTRDRGNGVLQKLWQIPWSFVLLLCAVAAVG
ncbi:MAG: rod shape-determining protein RodA, partial [Acetobacteraceae bacterium]